LAAWATSPDRKTGRANEAKRKKCRVSVVRAVGLGAFEALTADKLLGPLRRFCRMVVRNVKFTEEGFFIREERGKGKTKWL
jgi:hypothetical protein